ncbi:hypothetical protein KC19_6G136400 [Ceratodon purpureus]|uniref:Uncharacterized protein n=1 Tax=Ceratodon purpureus TaxID=3225 RepID=A0A8T0HHD5_CERPU|nr:hypothetical protein KC19_6G136400 [Ceratodon purpureus]
MGTTAVANHALSCHLYGSLINGTSGAESPSTSTSKRALSQRTGLLALPRQERWASRHRSHSRRNVLRPPAATAGHALLESTTSIDVEGMVAEGPTLLALSSDFDWQQSITELREEARGVLSAQGERETALERLGSDMHDWLHDSMFETILQPAQLQGAQNSEEELGVQIRVEELRCQAALQATEELAKGVDSSFDWESEAAELRQCIVIQERDDFEQMLLKSWESARDDMDKDAVLLQNEALKMHYSDDSYLTLFSDDIRGKSTEHADSFNKALEKSSTWWTLGVAMAGWFGSQAMDAIAVEESAPAAVAQAVTRTAPEWVAPTVLATPVVSYLLFTWYRNAVNPYAKLQDWVFGLITLAILGNIVLIATVGVRLY